MTRQEATIKYFENVISNIADQQIELGFYASGKSISSLEYKVEEDGTGKMTGDQSFYYQIHGRAPGKMPPIQEMIAWIQVKRLQISPWAVAKKIQREGTAVFRGERKGLNMQLAFDKAKPDYMKDLKSAVKKSIVEKIKQRLK